MGTHAEYVLWVGVPSENIGYIQHPFIKAIEENFEGVEKDGLIFKTIAMHGRTVGIGVVVQEMSWTPELNDSNLYHPSVAKEAEKTLRKVNSIFKKMKLSLPFRIFEHIDLGG
ncbi:MAG TPA: hypothetical protein P5548_03810 [Candidatus Moranbacteria bacterium]|nr:hypothetical protein [Candidatus Moranbacteria bacterium]